MVYCTSVANLPRDAVTVELQSKWPPLRRTSMTSHRQHPHATHSVGGWAILTGLIGPVWIRQSEIIVRVTTAV